MTETEAYITPLVRKLAEERGADLSKIKGTGIGGRIRRQDVIEATPDYQDRYDDTQPVWDIQELLFSEEEELTSLRGKVQRIETFAEMLDEGGNPLFAEMLRVILED